MRLTKQKRREQLLELALQMVREAGADELTLGYLAERAMLSRPITYEHFSTRAGLLLALYQMIEERQASALRSALVKAPANIEALSLEMSRGYFDCNDDLGKEAAAISAALQGSADMSAAQREIMEGYLDIMRDALTPYSTCDDTELRLRCVGLLGAAAAIGREVVEGRTPKQTAMQTFALLITAGFS